MKISIALGTYSLVNFARLNLAYLRNVFGEAPIIVYDGKSIESSQIAELAKEYGCAYHGESINRGHFSGCLQTAVDAVAFAKEHGCDIAIKLNQRTVLLSSEIPRLLAEAFSDPAVTLVAPGKYPADSIVDEKSRFHARFEQPCDVLCFRTSAWDAQKIADDYAQQWQTGTDKYDIYTEVFWQRQAARTVCAHPDWLTSHKGNPYLYLRKIQNTPEDYAAAARVAGLSVTGFDTKEWSAIKKGSYDPAPKA